MANQCLIQVVEENMHKSLILGSDRQLNLPKWASFNGFNINTVETSVLDLGNIVLLQNPKIQKMRHFYFSIILSSFLLDNFGQQSLERPAASSSYLPGKAINYDWDETTNAWVLSDTTVYVYNLQDQIVSATKRKGQYIKRTLYTYTLNVLSTQILTQNWDQSVNTWVNVSKSDASYNSLGEYSGSLSYNWDQTSNSWKCYSGDDNAMTYNSNNKVIENFGKTWNTISNDWDSTLWQNNYQFNSSNNITQLDIRKPLGNYSPVNWADSRRVVINWNSNNQPSEFITQIGFGNGTYQNYSRFTNISWQNWCAGYSDLQLLNNSMYEFTHDGCSPNRMLSYISEYYASNSWSPSLRSTFTYDSYGGEVNIVEHHNGTAWINSNKHSTFYDSNFNCTGSRHESWNETVNIWEKNSEIKYTNTYNANNALTEILCQDWWANSTSFRNLSKVVYKNHIPAGIFQNTLNDLNLIVFPNPASGEIKFHLNTNEVFEHTNISLFDNTGKLVMNGVLSKDEKSIDVSGLAPGIYFYQAFYNEKVAKGKLVVE